jgi:hypothetical protein
LESQTNPLRRRCREYYCALRSCRRATNGLGFANRAEVLRQFAESVRQLADEMSLASARSAAGVWRLAGNAGSAPA